VRTGRATVLVRAALSAAHDSQALIAGIRQ
jgi:hypothetical protein